MAAVVADSSPSARPVTQVAGSFVADPGPLGLAAFALTTFMLSAVNSGVIDAKVEPAVFGVALFYGGIVQVFAGMWEFVKGNTFGALAFSSYGAFWLSFWWLVTHLDAFAKDAPVGKAVGLFLLAWTIFTLYMTVAASKTSGALFGVFVLLSLTFIALTIGKFATGSSATTWTHLGGWLGLVTAAGAWYVSFAGVLSNTWKRPVLPTFPR
jgi:hypothetical protein